MEGTAILTRVFAAAAATLTATYNDLDSVRALFDKYPGEIAGVILEPVVGNSGYIAPTQEFLQVQSRIHHHSRGLEYNLRDLSW